jgi:sugar lactone lactonase YvrE
MSDVQQLLKSQNQLGEGTLWEPREKVLYWVDWGGGPIHRYDPATAEVETFEVDRPIVALGRREQGGLLTIARTGLDFWDPETGEFTPFVGQPEPDRSELCYNDAVVDQQGRLLVGTFNWPDVQEPDGSLWRVDPDGSLHRLDTGYATSNGLGLSPDGGTLYHAVTQHNHILAYDYDHATGTTSNRRVFVQVPAEEGLPDGLIVDAEGYVWCAFWDGWKLRRYDPDGTLEREYEFPVQLVICPGFGGDDLDELYVTTSWWGFEEEQRKEQPLAGDLFLIKPGVKGRLEFPFKG